MHRDDKWKIRCGAPGDFMVSATARAHAGGGALGSLDHDPHKVGSLTPNVLLMLHAPLKELDPAYDPKYRETQDLKKMPITQELLTDKEHCLDTTYHFELFSCGRQGCKAWPEAREGSEEAAATPETSVTDQSY